MQKSIKKTALGISLILSIMAIGCKKDEAKNPAIDKNKSKNSEAKKNDQKQNESEKTVVGNDKSNNDNIGNNEQDASDQKYNEQTALLNAIQLDNPLKKFLNHASTDGQTNKKIIEQNTESTVFEFFKDKKSFGVFLNNIVKNVDKINGPLDLTHYHELSAINLNGTNISEVKISKKSDVGKVLWYIYKGGDVNLFNNKDPHQRDDLLATKGTIPAGEEILNDIHKKIIESSQSDYIFKKHDNTFIKVILVD